jgi:hypothetical protein
VLKKKRLAYEKVGIRFGENEGSKKPVILSFPVFLASQVIVSTSGVDTTEIPEIYEKYMPFFRKN